LVDLARQPDKDGPIRRLCFPACPIAMVRARMLLSGCVAPLAIRAPGVADPWRVC